MKRATPGQPSLPSNPPPSPELADRWFAAAKQGDAKTLRAFVAAGFPLDHFRQSTPDPNHRSTAVQECAVHGHADCLRLLLGAGASPNAPPLSFLHPIIAAVRNFHAECAGALIKADCDLEAEDSFGQTAASHAIGARSQPNLLRALIEAGCDVDHSDHNGECLARLASFIDDRECLRLLIDAGCRLHALPGGTPLCIVHSAASIVSPECLPILLAAGADIDELDFEGRTPAMLAARHNALEAMRVLLDAGCRLDAVDFDGRDLLDWAKGFKDSEMIDMVSRPIAAAKERAEVALCSPMPMGSSPPKQQRL